MTKKLYIRTSQPADEKKIFDFYTQNEHQFVAKRDPGLWRERISAGAVTLIEDDGGNIVAAGIVYPIVVKDKNGHEVHKWSEIGSMRVALDGAGLFKPLLSALVLRAFFLEPPDDRFAVEIVKGNNHSRHVFEKEGATPFNIPKELLEKVLETLSPDDTSSGNVDWFQIGAEGVPHMAQNLVDAMNSPKIKNRKTGEEYELDFSRSALCTLFRQAIDKMAGNNYGDPAQPDMSQRLKGCRDRFAP